MIDCDERGPIDPRLAGHKAADLIALYRFSRDCEFDVPRFRVLTADLLHEYYRRRDWSPRLDYPVLPAPTHVPSRIREDLRPFAAFAAREIDQCVRGFDTALMLRSSLTLPEGGDGTACGCNASWMIDRQQAAALADGPLIPDLVSLFYKAYTTWSLDPAAAWTDRAGAVVVMDAVPFRCLGAVCLGAGMLSVEADGKYPYRRRRYLCDPDGEPTRAVPHDVLSPRDLKALARACWDVLRGRQPAEDLIEVEFGFGLDDRLYVVQERTFTAVAGRRPGAFHTVGAAAGGVRDVRGAARTPDALDRAAEPRIVALRREAPDEFDCFAFAWACAEDPARKSGVTAVLAEDTGRIAYGAGFRNHLTRSLMERDPDLFVGQIATAADDLPHRARLHSDGSNLDITPMPAVDGGTP